MAPQEADKLPALGVASEHQIEAAVGEVGAAAQTVRGELRRPRVAQHRHAEEVTLHRPPTGRRRRWRHLGRHAPVTLPVQRCKMADETSTKAILLVLF